jgi:hypothetical protein
LFTPPVFEHFPHGRSHHHPDHAERRPHPENEERALSPDRDLLNQEAGLRKEDVLINLVEVAKENWSFGNGEAQYAT